MKKIFGYIAVLVLLICGFAIFVSAQEPIVGISCPETAQAGEMFHVYVTVTKGSGICGGKMTLNYDSSALDVVSVTAEPLLGGAVFFPNLSAGENSIKVNWAGVTGISDAGNLFKITFKAKTLYEDKLSYIYISSIKVSDDNASGINVYTTTGNITILGKQKQLIEINANDEAVSGETYDVVVNINNAICSGGKFNLIYDSTKFSVDSASVGSVLSGTTAFVATNTPGAVRLTFAGLQAINSGEVLRVTFRSLSGALGDTELSIENCRMEDSDGNNVEFSAKAFPVSIVNELICRTVTTYEKQNDKICFNTKVFNCFEDAYVIIALYKNQVMQNVAISEVIDKKTEIIMNDADFDTAKIMLWDSLDSLRPIADAEIISMANEALKKLPDISCNIAVAKGGTISDNNPVLPSEIDGTPIHWAVSNTRNYAIIENRIAVVSETDLQDEVLTLTASVQGVDGDVYCRTFAVDVDAIYVEAENCIFSESEFSNELYRGNSFSFAVDVNPIVVSGFASAVDPIGTRIKYTYISKDVNGNAVDYTCNFSVNDGKFTVSENAAIGSVNTIRAEVGYFIGEQFNVVYVAERTFTVVPRTYTVTYVANGGIVYNNGREITSQEVCEERELFVGITASRLGYTFIGWYDNEGFQWNGNDTVFMPSNNITVYASWEAQNFTVTFDANGGENVEITTKVITHDSTFGEMPVPVRTGYTFMGWYTDVDGGELITADSVIKATEDINLYARWNVNTYTVTFNANGGENAGVATKAVTYDSTFGEMPVPVRSGYTFVGWYTDIDGGEQITVDSVIKVASDINLYARWRVNTYTVILDANGGSVFPSSMSVDYGSTYGNIPTPTRTGFTFNGWYTDSNGGNIISESTVYSRVEGQTLYARWTPIAYNVSWSSPSGCGISVSRTSSPYAGAAVGTLYSGSTIYYGDTLSVSYTAHTGYSISGKGATSITVSGNVTSSHIYATATANNYTYNVVCYSTNGTYLGGSTVRYAYGTTNTVNAPAFTGYATPAPQGVSWDSTTAKTITFLYTPNAVSQSQWSQDGVWWNYNGKNVLTFKVYLEYQNRTANTVQVRVKWVQTLLSPYRYGYAQYFGSNFGGQYLGETMIANSSLWAYSASYARTVTVYSDWYTINVSPTQSTVGFYSEWYAPYDAECSGSIRGTLYIPTY